MNFNSHYRRSPFNHFFMILSLAISFTGIHSVSRGQCDGHWLPGTSVAGVAPNNGAIVTEWDPDGAGPLRSRLVLLGGFTAAGNILARSLCAYEPVSGEWSAFGAGLPYISGFGFPTTLCALGLPNGDLIAGGTFTEADSYPGNRIARWHNNAWQSIGTGFNGTVSCVTVCPNGDIVAAGTFSASGSTAMNRIARWNGSSWLPLAGGLSSQPGAIIALANGDVLAALGSTDINRWDGSSWSTFSPRIAGVTKFKMLRNGDLLATSYSQIKRLSGGVWTPIGGIFSGGSINSIAEMPNGDLVVAGDFRYVDNVTLNHIARWNGTSWTTLGSGIEQMTYGISSAAATPTGDVIATGEFTSIAGVRAWHIARWNGVAWSPLVTDGIDGTRISGLGQLANDNAVVAGDFQLVGGQPARIASWNGETWRPLATQASGTATASVTLTNGELVIANYDVIDGVSATWVQRWNGIGWNSVGAGISGGVNALVTLPNSECVGLGSRIMARWNGVTWITLQSFSPGTADMRAMVRLPNGDLVAGGSFSSIGTATSANIARWNGAAWQALGTGVGGGFVMALTTMPNGDVIAAGTFTTAGGTGANHIARWNGTTWSPLGSGLDDTPRALTTLPNGDCVAGGYFMNAGGVSCKRIARWDGATWSSFGEGMNGPVIASKTLRNGDLMVGGDFTGADGVLSPYVAFWSTGPLISAQPQSLSVCPAGPANFNVVAAGNGPFAYQWQIESPAGSTAYVDFTSGIFLEQSTGLTFQVAANTTSNVQISGIQMGSRTGALRIRARVSGDCGSSTTHSALLSVCVADFNCDSTTDLFDYLDFVDAFASQSQNSDFNHDGTVDFFDYLDFVNAFSIGC